MDYVAEMLVKHLQQRHSDEFDTVAMRPRFARHARRIWSGKRASTPIVPSPGSSNTPPLFFVLDRHSICFTSRTIPMGISHACPRTGSASSVTTLMRSSQSCPVLRERYLMATGDGHDTASRGSTASLVFVSTDSVKERILSERLIGEPKLIKAPYGIADEYWRRSTEALPHVVPPPYLLHVGGNFPRKRLDVLLEVFSKVRKAHPALKLVQVGAQFGDAELALVHRLGIEQVLIRMSALSRTELANLYALSSLVLIPSEREGFGLHCSRHLRRAQRLSRATSRRYARSVATP
jgi:glycosyltransferase involved in cell wall biosynthesis